MLIEGRYDGKDCHGHYLLHDVTGDVVRDHLWLNGNHSNFPDDLKLGTRVRFYASVHHRGPKPARVTDCREVEVIA